MSKKLQYKNVDKYYTNKRTHHLARVHREYGRFRDYTSITHSDKIVVDKYGNHIALKLVNNPNPKDNRQAYVIDYVYHGIDRDFKTRKSNYKTSKANKRIFDKIIKKH